MILVLVLFACSGCSSIGNAFAPVKPRTQTAAATAPA
jgi:uncharacterized metal-binding protein